MSLSIQSVVPGFLAVCGVFLAFALHLIPLSDPNLPWLLILLFCMMGRYRWVAPLGVLLGLCFALDVVLGAPLGWHTALILPSYWAARFVREHWPIVIARVSISLLVGVTVYQFSEMVFSWWAGLSHAWGSELFVYLMTLLCVSVLGALPQTRPNLLRGGA